MSDLKTPYFVLNRETILDELHNLNCAINEYWPNTITAYSVKTNSLPYLTELLSEQGVYAEVVSQDEFEMVQRCGYQLSCIVCNGPVKKRDFIVHLLNNHVIVNLDSHAELEYVGDYAAAHKQEKFGVGLRVNVDIEKYFPGESKAGDKGSRFGFCMENDEKQMLEAYQDVVRYSPSGKAIIEEYIDGREFSVEYISHNGRHYFLQITDKVTSGEPHFVEMQHHQPANISESLSLRIREMVEKALTALKIENSASHTEIKLNSKDELYIIEIGACMGGDRIASDLVRLSTGYDFVEGVVKLACGDFEEPIKTLNCYSGVYFYSALQPFVADYVKNKDKYPEIVDASINNLPLVPVVSNGQRNGYLLYQSQNHKFVIYE